MNYPKFEKVLEVQLGDKNLIVFPRRLGGTVVDAMSILNGALRGKELPMIPAHSTADRSSDVEFVNSFRVNSAKQVMKEVPASIVALYSEPDNESEEDREVRLKGIEEYFEQF